jgi:uncharacterized protein YeaO (DUF488 family)
MNRPHKKKNVERKTLENGEQNPKYVDLLTEDKPIAGQKFVCLSFVSPEKILKNKEIYYFEQFLKKWEFQKSMEVFIKFLNFIAFKYKLNFNDIYENFKEFTQDEEIVQQFQQQQLKIDYDTFIEQNIDELDKEFAKLNKFTTSIRGVKVRGSYPTQEEAELRAKLLREIDSDHNIFVGPVGLWLPWDPEPAQTERVEYSEELLNQLMHEKKKNEEYAKIAFEERKQEQKKKAIEDNMKNAEKSGNLLTQTIDSDGNLIGTHNSQLNTLAKRNITSKDIHSELFEGDNIVMKKK